MFREQSLRNVTLIGCFDCLIVIGVNFNLLSVSIPVADLGVARLLAMDVWPRPPALIDSRRPSHTWWQVQWRRVEINMAAARPDKRDESLSARIHGTSTNRGHEGPYGSGRVGRPTRRIFGRMCRDRHGLWLCQL